MNRSNLCKRVAANMSLTNADAAAAIDAVILTITGALAEGKTVTIAGFGTFSTRDRAARQARNPRTGEAVPVPPPLGCLRSRPGSPFAMRSTDNVLTLPFERVALDIIRTLRRGNLFVIPARRCPRCTAPPVVEAFTACPRSQLRCTGCVDCAGKARVAGGTCGCLHRHRVEGGQGHLESGGAGCECERRRCREEGVGCGNVVRFRHVFDLVILSGPFASMRFGLPFPYRFFLPSSETFSFALPLPLALIVPGCVDVSALLLPSCWLVRIYFVGRFVAQLAIDILSITALFIEGAHILPRFCSERHHLYEPSFLLQFLCDPFEVRHV